MTIRLYRELLDYGQCGPLNKIGRIEKRQGFTTDKRVWTTLQNLNMSGAPRQTTQYTSISSTLINDKITKIYLIRMNYYF